MMKHDEKINYTKLVQIAINEYKTFPIDMLGIGDESGEYTYLNNTKPTYIRTVKDIDGLLKGDRKNKKILEIGSFLGTVSVSLKRLGFDVHALDIPEFHKSAKLRAHYKRNNIPFDSLNLRNSRLPYDSNSFDAVIICEVMEHLNFNPLPVLREINRVLKKGGKIYIGMPNQSYFLNRIRLLLGLSINNPIDDFFKQLDRKDNMIVGLHWREYTLNETTQLVQRMGFSIIQKYHFYYNKKDNYLKNFIQRIIFLYPPFRPFIVVVGQKVTTPNYDFFLTEANS